MIVDKVIFVCILKFVGGSVFPQSGVVWPAATNVLPCMDTVENCGRNNYLTQQTDAASFSSASVRSATMNTAAGDLLDTVVNLKTSTDALTDLVDLGNKSNGGLILQLSAGRQLSGIVPFMGTLAKRMTDSVTTRGRQLGSLVTSIKNSVDGETRAFTAANATVNQQIATISEKIQSDIITSSNVLRNLYMQADSKLTTSTRQFRSAQNAGPASAATNLNTALTLEANDRDGTRALLANNYAQVAAMPGDVANYISALLADLDAFQSATEAGASSQTVDSQASFISQMTAKADDLLKRVQGLGTTDPKHLYYSLSIAQAAATGLGQLLSLMHAKNVTERTQMTDLGNTISALNLQVPIGFQPLLNALNDSIATLSGADNNFATDTMRTLADANSTLTQSGITGYGKFRTNIDGLIQATGGILSGQTTAVTSALLGQIGSMTQGAGKEVKDLTGLMYKAGKDSLETDAIRQAILNNSNDNVYTAIGSNEAALNASLTTIKQFMGQSTAEIDWILRIVGNLSSDAAANVNATATLALSQLWNMTNVTSDSQLGLIAAYVNGSNATMAAEAIKFNTTYSQIQIQAKKVMADTNATIAFMNATNTAEVYKRMAGLVSDASSFMNQTVDRTNELVGSVVDMSTASEANRVTISRERDAIVANESDWLANSTWPTLLGLFKSVESGAETTASNLASNESVGIQDFSRFAEQSTDDYAKWVGSKQAEFDALVNQLSTNVTLANSLIKDSAADAAAARTAIVQSVGTLGDLVTQTAATVDSATTDRIDSDISDSSARVRSSLNDALQVGLDAISTIANFTSESGSLSSNVQGLLNAAEGLATTPKTMLEKGWAMMQEFGDSLEKMKGLVVDQASDTRMDAFNYDAQVTDIEAQSNDLVGKVNVAQTTSDDLISDGIGKIREIVAAPSASFKGGIDAVRDQTQTGLQRQIDSANLYMNQTTKSWLSSVKSVNSSIYEKLDMAKGVNERISDLSGQISLAGDAATDVGTSAQAAAAAMSTSLGATMQEQIDALIASSGKTLTRAQMDQVARQLATANVGVGAARDMSSGALMDAVNSAISAATSASGTAQANNLYVQSRMSAISSAASSTVTLTANDIAAVIAMYSNDSTATRKALADQLAAAGVAQASVDDAARIWAALKDSTSSTASDALEDLTDLKSKVLGDADTAMKSAHSDWLSDIADLTGRVGDVSKSASGYQDDTVTPQLGNAVPALVNAVDEDAAHLQADVNKQVANLRGFVNAMNSKLADRLGSILAQSDPFKTALHTAVVKDITGIASR